MDRGRVVPPHNGILLSYKKKRNIKDDEQRGGCWREDGGADTGGEGRDVEVKEKDPCFW